MELSLCLNGVDADIYGMKGDSRKNLRKKGDRVQWIENFGLSMTRNMVFQHHLTFLTFSAFHTQVKSRLYP